MEVGGNAKKKVYLARHGERLDFVDPWWRSSAEFPDDAPLTLRGERQAQDLGKRLRSQNVGNIYASPFQRCVRTAVNAASQISDNAMVRVEPGVCEWLSAIWFEDTDNGPIWRDIDRVSKDAGQINGITRIDTTYSPVRPHNFNIDGFPESKKAHFERCAAVVGEILQKDEGSKNILLVGHGSSVEGLFYALCPGLRMGPVTCK